MAEVEAADGGAIALAVGDEVVVRLPENGTTGYVWSVGVRGAGVEVAEDRSVPPASGAAPGSGGEHVVRLRGAAPGTAELHLRLARPWEDGALEERRVAVTVS